jgi:hypothetical protein
MLSVHISKKTDDNELKKWISGLSDEDIVKIMEHSYKLSTFKKKTIGSSQKGLEGEKIVSDILNKHYEIKNTSKYAKAGDFHIKTEVGQILVEVKNYSKTVGRMELEKFERDIARDNSIKGAIFISLDSQIVGYKESVHFELELIDGRNIPVAYINSQNPKIIKTMIDLIIAHIKSRIKTNDIDVDFVISKVDEMSKQINLMSQCRNQISEMRISINKSIDDLYKNIALLEIGLSKIIGDIHSQIKWKREIPISCLNELYKFLDDKFQLNKQSRQNFLQIRKLVKELYFPYVMWNYTEKYISTGNVRIYMNFNKPIIQFDKDSLTRITLKRLVKMDKVSINKRVSIPIEKNMVNLITEIVWLS